jgi:hypothetical protein
MNASFKIILACVSMLFLFTACSTDKTETPETIESVTPTVFGDEEYANLLREEVPELSGVGDDLLVENADAACEGLDAGLTLEDLIEAGMSSGLSPEAVGALLGAGVSYQCPEYGYIFN